MVSTCLIQALMLYAFFCVTNAKRDEIQLEHGQPYNLTLTSNYPEEGRPSSTWLVRAPDDCRILVRFVEFMLQNIDDTLVVGTGSSVRESSSILARFSGMFPSQSILVPSQRAWLKLNTSSGSVLPHRLEIILEALHHERDIALSDNQTTEIASPDYPNGYPNYADILWRISAPAGQSVTFRFRDIDLEDRYDKIIIGTGSDFSDRGTRLAFISNRYNKTDLPTDLIIPGDAEIWLRFHADISKTFRGFLIEITAGPDPFEELNVEPSERQIEVASPLNIASENYPSPYPRSQNVTWYLNPPINKLIRVDVISCHLEPKHDSVKMDTRLGNGSDVLFLNGSFTPRGFYAEFPVNESVVIRFESDYSVAYQGFWIRVSAVVEKKTKITPMTKVELAEKQPDVAGSSTNNNRSNGFMIPMFSAIGVVVLLALVSTLTISCYFVRRRRTKPMVAGHQVLSHLYTTPDTRDFRTPAHPRHRSQDSPSHSIPMVQVSCSSRVDDPHNKESDYQEFDNDDDDHYDAVGQNTSTSSSHSPGIDHHHYSVAAGDPAQHDTGVYCKIEHDYATAINDTENEYANFQEGDMTTPEVESKMLAIKPFYMTTIENTQKATTTIAYHRYLPMTACAAKKPTDNEQRLPPGATTKENDFDDKKHAYVNLTTNLVSDETTDGKVHGVKNDSNDVTKNETFYEAMSPKSNDDRVNETVDELENESAGSGDRTVVDTYTVGHQREHGRHQVKKPKVAPKRKRNKGDVIQKNSYENATYEKYSIS
eukprot:XP_781991.3 PREDICTED: uncharacterized protein LOC576610 [Strongylocentrotus purpuratus]